MGHNGQALLFSRPVAAGAAAFLIVTVLGCMSLSFGGRTYEAHAPECRAEDDSYVQHGTAHVRGHEEQDVYYPVPYAATPNLELGECPMADNDFRQCVIVDQQPDHFRLRNTDTTAADVGWTARGVRQPPAALPVALTAPSPRAAAPAELPPEPTPAR